MSVVIRLVSGDDERRSVYEFRYRIYVEEMHRPQAYADHASRQIVDPFDETAVVVAAFDGPRIVGTQRLNVGSQSDFGEYADFYNMRAFGSYWPHQLSMSSRLMVDPDYRRTMVPMQLAINCYKLALDEGSRFDFMDCNDHLIGYFKKLGFRQLFARFTHPEYGKVTPMVLAGWDSGHLDCVRSPLRKHLPRSQVPDPSVEFFESMLARQSEPAGSGKCRNKDIAARPC